MRVHEKFKHYWPLYVENHKKKMTRKLHFFGLFIYFLSWPLSLYYYSLLPLIISIIFGYFLSFFTHKYIEKSPINLKHPYFGFIASLKMFFLMLFFKMDKEMIILYGKKSPLDSDRLLKGS